MRGKTEGVRRRKEGIPPLLTIIVDVLCERGEKKEGHSSSANNYCGCTV